jgi:hypothetical protein
MSVNLIPEYALPKSFFLEAEFRPGSGWRESQLDRPGNGKDHFAGDAERDGRSVQGNSDSRVGSGSLYSSRNSVTDLAFQ